VNRSVAASDLSARLSKASEAPDKPQQDTTLLRKIVSGGIKSSFDAVLRFWMNDGYGLQVIVEMGAASLSSH
jgi:hypothetical protein